MTCHTSSISSLQARMLKAKPKNPCRRKKERNPRTFAAWDFDCILLKAAATGFDWLILDSQRSRLLSRFFFGGKLETKPFRGKKMSFESDFKIPNFLWGNFKDFTTVNFRIFELQGSELHLSSCPIQNRLRTEAKDYRRVFFSFIRLIGFDYVNNMQIVHQRTIPFAR